MCEEIIHSVVAIIRYILTRLVTDHSVVVIIRYILARLVTD